MKALSAAVQTCTARADRYARREPERTVLHRVVSEHWPRFSRARRGRRRPAPVVVRDFEEYLRCGVLEHGVVHLACSRCGHSMLVVFSCKRRGFCPSCLGRRMADLAAHLVDDVLPEVPLRQWVCSLPWTMRCMLAFDRTPCAEVLEVFIAALSRSLKWRAKRHLSLRSVDDALVGAVTVIQRSASALRVSPHFHTLALDGVYVRGAEGALVFHALPAPSAEEVAQVAGWTHAASCACSAAWTLARRHRRDAARSRE